MAPVGRKSQAAMEFLTNYGWSGLIVVIVIGALSAYVVYTVRNSTDTCTSSPEIGYVDYSYSNGVLTMLLKNNLDKTIHLNYIDARGCTLRVMARDATMTAGKTAKVVIGCLLFDGSITVSYKTVENSLDHVATAKCSVRGSTGAPDNPDERQKFTQCMNANNAEVCDNLADYIGDFPLTVVVSKSDCQANYGLCLDNGG